MAVAESFRGFRRIGFDKTGIAVGQVQGKIVNLPFNTGYDRPGFAEVDLGMAWIMGQRHKNLFAQALPGPDIIRHDGDATAITMLVAQPFENAFAGMALLLRLAFVIFQDLVDDAGIGIKLRTLRRLAPLLSRRDRMFENLRHRLAVNTKPPRRLPLAQAITMTGQPYS